MGAQTRHSLEIARQTLAMLGEYKHLREDLFATLVDLYVARRIGAFRELLVESGLLPPDGIADYLAMERWLRAERDPRMAERALPLLRRGGAFIAVGALHLIGETGLVARFRQAGYTVTRVW